MTNADNTKRSTRRFGELINLAGSRWRHRAREAWREWSGSARGRLWARPSVYTLTSLLTWLTRPVFTSSKQFINKWPRVINISEIRAVCPELLEVLLTRCRRSTDNFSNYGNNKMWILSVLCRGFISLLRALYRPRAFHQALGLYHITGDRFRHPQT